MRPGGFRQPYLRVSVSPRPVHFDERYYFSDLLERLPKSEDIRNVRKGLKGAHKHIDKPKAKKRLPPPKG